jgi:hypothetical protein
MMAAPAATGAEDCYAPIMALLINPMIALCGIVFFLFGIAIFWRFESTAAVALIAVGTMLILPWLADCIAQYQSQY